MKKINTKLIQSIIEKAFKLGVIGTNFKNPIRFKSGIMSPIYCDWRKCSEDSQLMKLITTAFIDKMNGSYPEVVMGVAAGAVPHSERLAMRMGSPSAWIRPGAKPKDYGLNKLIEGASVNGKEVFLIEDLFSTGGSALDNVKILLKAGVAKVQLCSIFSYDMQSLHEEFEKENMIPDSLITIHDILPTLKNTLPSEEYEMLIDWVKDPVYWFARYKTKFDFGFLTTLRESTERTKSIICMGMDPVIKALHHDYAKFGIEGWTRYMQDLEAEMISQNILPAMFKPNESAYMIYNEPRLGKYPGNESLNSILRIGEKMKIPNTMDAKRGDIGTTSKMYAEAYFEGWKPDALTVHPYMGDDSVIPFGEYCNEIQKKGVYVLNLTSNKGSENFQKKMMATGKFLYEEVSGKIIEWAQKRPGLGAVVGATHPKQLEDILKIFAGKDIPLLIPGAGTQGGSAKDVFWTAQNLGFETSLLRINSSSGITHPWFKNENSSIPSKNEMVETAINELKILNEETDHAGYPV